MANPVVTITVISLPLLNGCMMMGMSGGMMRGDHSHQTHDAEASERIVKEMIVDDYHLIAEFPPLLQGRESILSLHIHSSDSSHSIPAAAKIIISREEAQEGIENILMQEVLAKSEEGMYTYAFTPRETGSHRLTFLLERLGDSPSKEPLILSTKQVVKAMSEGDMDMKNQGGFSVTPLLIVGGAVMVAMMLLMFGSRHF